MDTIYQDFVRYFLEQFGISDQLIVYVVVCNSMVAGTEGYTYVIESIVKEYTITIGQFDIMYSLTLLAHELTHIQQQYDGSLTFTNDNIIWLGRVCISSHDYAQLALEPDREAAYKVYAALPFESGAIYNSAVYPKQYIDNKLANLIGISVELDDIIKGILS